jgi:hypothetical protein
MPFGSPFDAIDMAVDEVEEIELGSVLDEMHEDDEEEEDSVFYF